MKERAMAKGILAITISEAARQWKPSIWLHTAIRLYTRSNFDVEEDY